MNHRKIILFSILLILVAMIAAILFLFLSPKTTQTGYADIPLIGSSPRISGDFDPLKTRNGLEEGGKIVISLRNPPVGRQKVTVHLDVISEDGFGNTSTIASTDIQEGETKYLDNTGEAGKYYSPVFSNPNGKTNEDGTGEICTVGIKFSLDETKNDTVLPSDVG